MLPKDADKPISGEFALRSFEKKIGPPTGLLSKSEQKSYQKEFYEKRENKYFTKNHFVLADVEFSKKIIKGHNLKRAVIAKIIDCDFTQRPALFTLENVFGPKKTFPIKVNCA